MSEKDKKAQLKALVRNSKKLQKALSDARAERTHSGVIVKGADKVDHYLTKFTTLMPDEYFDSIPFTNDVSTELLNTWNCAIEHLIKMPQHNVTPSIYFLMCKLIQIKQIQPMALADFPAPDEVAPQVEKLLELYYSCLAKTALYFILALNDADEIEEYEKKEKKPNTLVPPRKKKKLSTFQFSSTVKPINPDYYDDAAHAFVLISQRVPDIYEGILETVNYLSGAKIGEKGCVVLTEEVKENFQMFKKWESVEKYISGKSPNCEKLCQAIDTMDMKWLVHFQCRGRFAIQYIKAWIEYIVKNEKDVKNYPGYSIFYNEINSIMDLTGEELVSPIFVCAEAYAAFSCFDPEIYKTVLTKKVKKTNFYDIDQMGELLLIEHFMYTYYGNKEMIVKNFDYDMFESVHSKIMESDNYALICLLISTIYQIIPVLPGESRKRVVSHFILSHRNFDRMFCHWNHNVRVFFCELLLYKITVCPSWNRVKSNALLQIEKPLYDKLKTSEFDMFKTDVKIVETVNNRISSVKKAKEKGFDREDEKKLSIYISPALKDFESEYTDYKNWENTNAAEPLYKLLEMTRLNRLDKDVI
ncbi:hypothetical protein EIN_170590 [Entamoeba invadens IP1]|uniref:Uncharacterized protein n=1 Tax=Entamoeba invadens IP1 TaxID=370355 RepID=A0A0A1TVN0_ENTIV|nr:hypothetical protein EIN_170590 [Entamoeba invadens IP1]ELP84534.1 hypothetical protein EIN_170590 [Entamoeba invadens IP1]|eukprot:XP_004183880.1 hypothetical protein EIN_170590 [Entamoeba invadens IP1]